MSTLNVANVTDGTTTVGTSFVVNGCAKVWANFDGTGTISLRNSLNVSGIVDEGTSTSDGGFTLNFSTSFANANWSGESSRAAERTNPSYTMVFLSGNIASNSCRVVANGATGGIVDSSYNYSCGIVM